MKTTGKYLNIIITTGARLLIVILLLLSPVLAEANTASNIVVLGAVEKPGSFAFQPNMTVRDAIRLAYGITAEADASKAIVIRKGAAEPLNLDLDKALNIDAANISLVPKDIIYVPQKASPSKAYRSKLSGPYVVVAGAVDVSGTFRFGPNMTLLDAMKLAGKADPDADTSNIFILRRFVPEALHVDLDKAMGSDMTANPELLPEDNVFIPKKVTSAFYAAGSVTKPGVYQVKEQVSLLQALSMAGGLAVTANANRVLVTRSEKAFIVDVRLIIQSGQPDFTIQAGDNIYVPQISLQHKKPKPMQIAR